MKPSITSFVLICLLSFQSTTLAQSAWEVTPYQVQVWYQFGDQPDLPSDWRSDFSLELHRQLRVIARAACAITVLPAPDSARTCLASGVDAADRESLMEADPELSKQDKLFLVSINGSHAGYQIQVREFDCQLAHFGPTDTATVDVLSQIPGRTAQVLASAFSPVVRIDRYSDGIAYTRLRAAALIRGEDALGRLHDGDVLLPFDRRIGNDGKAALKNIRPIDWTYLRVPSSGTGLEVISGFRQPFRSKRNRRNQQLAIRSRATTNESTVKLQTRAKSPAPLIGYEIHEKGAEKTTTFLGYTDWRGELRIPKNDASIRILLVRSGDRVLAKLPIVPGLRSEIVASMRDDRQRVETDGFLSGIQTALIDLVARRESLTARIRTLIKADELDDAEVLLNQFRDLPTQTDFQREIQQQQRSLNVTDYTLRKRIDTMFVQTYQTLGKYLDANRLSQLEADFAAAKNR